MNCLIPVRIRTADDNGEAEQICQHEVTITVQTKGEGLEASATEDTEDSTPRLRVVGLGQASAWLIKLSGDSAPVSYHVGQRLTEYDGEEIPRQVAEEVMNSLHWAAVSRAVEKLDRRKEMTSNQADTEKFIVEMTADQAREAAEALSRIGVDFEPEEALTVYDPDDDTYWVMRGQDLDHLLESINTYLEENHPGRRVPEPTSLEGAAEALRMAYWEFEWRKWEVEENLWASGTKTWEDMTAKYPALFNEKTE